MLALKEWYNFPLTIEPIEIPPGDAKAPEFLHALRKLLPQHTLDKDTKWDQLYLILFKGKPIGLTSPTTLVCTASNCLNCISGVPWFDGQYLFDPTDELKFGRKGGSRRLADGTFMPKRLIRCQSLIQSQRSVPESDKRYNRHPQRTD